MLGSGRPFLMQVMVPASEGEREGEGEGEEGGAQLPSEEELRAAEAKINKEESGRVSLGVSWEWGEWLR